jgi:acyl-CoA ligase (AMP-forming) (exosortase A-associated)
MVTAKQQGREGMATSMRTQLHQVLGQMAERRPDAPALTIKDTTVSYAELWDEARAFAAGLHRVGLGRGERVAIYLEKRIETVASVFGASAAGGAFVPVNPLLRPQQVGYILDDCSVQVLVTSADRLERLGDELEQCPSVRQVIVVDEGGSSAGKHEYTIRAWGEFLDAGDAPDPNQIDLDMAAIFYTSGSTGKPKGVVLSHRNLIVGGESVSQYLGNHAGDCILAALPLSFDAGFSQLTTGFTVGAHVVLVNYLLPREVVQLCAKHGVTGLTCVPPLWLQLAEQSWPEEATKRMRYFANTGGRMPKSALDRLRAIFPGAKPYLMYGLTEAFRSTYLDPAEVDRRPDSIGKAIPNAEILLVRDDGSPCEPGEEGELVHRGALVAMGYWNDPERTAERFRPVPNGDGGICTTETAVFSGDLVRRDEEGFLYFVSRKDEMIKTSGYRVSPTEIEEVAYGTGLVGDAVALGMDDERLGQHIVLAVSPANGHLEPDELLGELRRQLPLYMVPKHVVVRPSLPRSPNNKFDRNLLREELAAR